MGGGPIDPTQILAGAQNLPNQFQPPQQPASMTPQVQNPGAMPGGDISSQLQQQALQQGQMGTQAFQQGQQNISDLSQRANALQQQLGSLQRPKTSVTDEPWMKMQPVHGQGVGGDLKNLLSDIGRGMLAGVASTGPGRSIQQGLYGGGERAYRMQSGNLAQQIQDIQKQEETATQGLGAAGQMAYRPMYGLGAAERGQAAIDRVGLQKQMEPQKLALQQKAQDLQKQIAAGKLSAEQARTEMQREVGMAHAAAMNNVASVYSDQRDRDVQVNAAENEWKQSIEHPIMEMLGMVPSAPTQQTAPVQGPKATGTKAPAKKAAGGDFIYARDPQGKLHKAAAGTPLPQGWKPDKGQ